MMSIQASVSTAAFVLLAGCAAAPAPESEAPTSWGEVRETVHRGDDDLLSAGLGLSGLRGPAPRLTDSDQSEAALLRRLAVHTQYKGLSDLTATGGFAADAALANVPGREFQAFARLPGAGQPFRVLLQLPDAFDPDRPCLVVAPASGSRGVYGALPVAGPWALPRGCALALTDKGAGSDLFDHASDTGVALDGTRAGRGSTELGLVPDPAAAPAVSVPHAHSGDNPEADWGRHTLVATRFGLAMLARAWPEHAPFTPERTRVIAAAISNGGSAVLRALEIAEPGLFDAAAVGAPNVTPPGARPLYDYATEAALYQPCLMADPAALMAMPFGNPSLLPAGQQRCQELHAAGLIDEPTADAARARLKQAGFEHGALDQTAVNSALELWHSVTALYASAYLRTPVDAMPCGYSVAAEGPEGQPVAADPVARNLWWATSSGVVPGGGVGWIEPDAGKLANLQCLRALWTGDDARAGELRAAVEATRATGRPGRLPLILVHGMQDGLIPIAFSTRPYVEQARAAGDGPIALWQIDGAQHFDVIVPLPGVSNRYRPLIPYLWQALDRIEQVLDGTATIGDDRLIRAIDRS